MVVISKVNLVEPSVMEWWFDTWLHVICARTLSGLGTSKLFDNCEVLLMGTSTILKIKETEK